MHVDICLPDVPHLLSCNELTCRDEFSSTRVKQKFYKLLSMCNQSIHQAMSYYYYLKHFSSSNSKSKKKYLTMHTELCKKMHGVTVSSILSVYISLLTFMVIRYHLLYEVFVLKTCITLKYNFCVILLRRIIHTRNNAINIITLHKGNHCANIVRS